MLKKTTNKDLNRRAVTTWAQTYMMLALVLCIVAMLGMAAAGISIAQEQAQMTVVATMGVLVSIGIAFLLLDCVSDTGRYEELLKRPFGFSWTQWGLMCSGIAVALVVGPFLNVEDDEEKKAMLRVAAGAGTK